MPITGEKPGKGTYACIACGQAVILDDNTDRLPPCLTCSGVNYNRGVKIMAKPVSPTGGTNVAEFIWADDHKLKGWIDLDNFMVFDMEDHSSSGQGKKIGHKKGKYKKLGEKVKTMHIREKDKENI